MTRPPNFLSFAADVAELGEEEAIRRAAQQIADCIDEDILEKLLAAIKEEADAYNT